MIILIGTLLGALLPTSAYAGENRSGFYLGAGVGNARYHDDGLSNVVAGTDVERNSDGVKGYIGYQFNNVVGIELGCTDYDKNTAIKETSDYSYSAKSYSVASNLGYSFLDSQLRLFAILGLAYVKIEHENTSPLYESITEDRLAFHNGIGFQFEPNILKGLGLRIAYESDTYFTSIETYGYLSTNEVYIQRSRIVYAAIQYKF